MKFETLVDMSNGLVDTPNSIDDESLLFFYYCIGYYEYRKRRKDANHETAIGAVRRLDGMMPVYDPFGHELALDVLNRKS